MFCGAVSTTRGIHTSATRSLTSFCSESRFECLTTGYPHGQGWLTLKTESKHPWRRSANPLFFEAGRGTRLPGPRQMDPKRKREPRLSLKVKSTQGSVRSRRSSPTPRYGVADVSEDPRVSRAADNRFPLGLGPSSSNVIIPIANSTSRRYSSCLRHRWRRNRTSPSCCLHRRRHSAMTSSS